MHKIASASKPCLVLRSSAAGPPPTQLGSALGLEQSLNKRGMPSQPGSQKGHQHAAFAANVLQFCFQAGLRSRTLFDVPALFVTATSCSFRRGRDALAAGTRENASQYGMALGAATKVEQHEDVELVRDPIEVSKVHTVMPRVFGRCRNKQLAGMAHVPSSMDRSGRSRRHEQKGVAGSCVNVDCGVKHACCDMIREKNSWLGLWYYFAVFFFFFFFFSPHGFNFILARKEGI